MPMWCGRRRGEHGVEAAPRDGLLQVLDQALDVDLLAGQVGVHQGLVFALLDDRLDQRAAGLLDPVGLVARYVGVGTAAAGVVVEALRQQADQALNGALAVSDRQVQRRHRVAERGPAGGERLLEVAPLVVDLGDHDCARRADGSALVPEHLGQPVDAVRGRDREQGGVRGPQSGPQVAGEVGVAGGVQQVDLDALVHERHQRQVDRAALPDLDLVEVAGGAAILDPAFALDRAGRDQEGLGQRCLSCSRVADQHHVAHAFGLAGR